MSSIPISLFDPRYSIHLGGFDNRGCVASINNANQTGFTVSGYFSDLADFVTLYLFDTDDTFGHLYTSRYLPTTDLTGVVLEFDLATTGCFYPGSSKFQSVFQGALQWVKPDSSNSGNIPPALVLSSPSGGSAASVTITLGGTPALDDRVQIIYLGNDVFDYLEDGSDTINSIINSTLANGNGYIGLVAQINAANLATPTLIPFTATGTSTTITITSTEVNSDGNGIQFLCQHKTGGTTTIGPTNAKMAGGVDPTSVHVTIDFATLGLETLQQAWLTIGPPQPWDSSGSSSTVQAFNKLNFSFVVSNISLTDPNGKCPLSISGVGSVLVDSRDAWVTYQGSDWSQIEGDYHHGFAQESSNVGDTVTIVYSCQSEHDLYLGTVLGTSGAQFSITLDGVAQPGLDLYFVNLSPNVCRREIANGVAAGTHTVILTLATGAGSTAVFDFLQASISSSPTPATSLGNISAACDFDTDQTYKISPARLSYIFTTLGFAGTLDFYGGVFFAHTRRRRGGNFLSCTITISGFPFNNGTGFGDGDEISVTLGIGLGATTIAASTYPADTVSTVAQRIVNGINGTFVGIRASATLGVITVTVLSPINGFSITVSAGTSVDATISLSGVLLIGASGGGNEGIWEVDPTLSLPLNKGFTDYLSDFATTFNTAGINFVVAFSQELLAPPEPSSGSVSASAAWIQRFLDSNSVLTSTEFGSWGTGYVEAVSGSGTVTIQQTGHGYITGYLVSIGGIGAYPVTVSDDDHYTVVGSASVGDQVQAQLQTSQCNFNPATFTAYQIYVYEQVAALLGTAGITTPWLQFGEVEWWFFPGSSPTDTQGMAYYDAYTSSEATTILGRALATFNTPNDSPGINSFADANFLVDLLQTHIHSIVTAVLAATSSAQFELLFPYDINWPTSYVDPMGVLPPIGGQLNRYVNLPTDYCASGSDIDRLKMEALAWGTTYRNLTNAIATFLFYTTDTSWSLSDVLCLIPWDNQGCPFENEFLQSQNVPIPQICFWALDHIILFSWGNQMPTQLAIGV